MNDNDNDNIYVHKGYKSRADYLKCMAADYGIDKNAVFAIADLLGENEDFDGLLSSLEDYQDFGGSEL